jgi:hypothetical protein
MAMTGAERARRHRERHRVSPLQRAWAEASLDERAALLGSVPAEDLVTALERANRALVPPKESPAPAIPEMVERVLMWMRNGIRLHKAFGTGGEFVRRADAAGVTVDEYDLTEVKSLIAEIGSAIRSSDRFTGRDERVDHEQ